MSDKRQTVPFRPVCVQKNLQESDAEKEGRQMEQELGKRTFLSEDIQKALAGKRIVLAGIENNFRRSVSQQLLQLAAQSGDSFTVSQNLQEAGPQDYVLLFGCPDGDAYVCAAQESEARGAEGACTVHALPELLVALAQKKPAAAVFISDVCVYGKCFGKEKARKEQELGYVCHTAIPDELSSRLRFAENLAHRLAKEEGVPVAVVRAGTAGKTVHTEESGTVAGKRMQAEAILRVLLYGKKGEAYNLPDTDLTDDGHSPLSPMQIVADTTKIEALTRR